MNLKATLHLASGAKIETLVADDVGSADEFLDVLEEELTGDRRPGWRIVGDALFFSQALSAIQVEEYSDVPSQI